MPISVNHRDSKNTSCIYKITNIVNNKYYIGSTNSLYFRIKKHINLLIAGKHSNKFLQRSWDKYGEFNFNLEILELCEKNKLRSREQYYLDNYIGEYNLSPDSISVSGYKWSEESKKRFSQKKKGVIFSDKHKKKLSENCYWAGRTGSNNIRSKKVKQYSLNNELIKEFDSIIDASKETGVNSRCISMVCLNQRKQTGGFIWKHSK